MYKPILLIVYYCRILDSRNTPRMAYRVSKLCSKLGIDDYIAIIH